jgi:hypothetical protein
MLIILAIGETQVEELTSKVGLGKKAQETLSEKEKFYKG